ncbi:MAG: YheU family protein [Steroidobacteraceae bacterium]
MGACLTDSNEVAAAVVVPYTELSEEALRGVLESFVLREGTEYGDRDFSLDQKVAQVIKQLRRGEARIVFDPDSETIDIVVVAVARGKRNSQAH